MHAKHSDDQQCVLESIQFDLRRVRKDIRNILQTLGGAQRSGALLESNYEHAIALNGSTNRVRAHRALLL